MKNQWPFERTGWRLALGYQVLIELFMVDSQ
jgi:hypothetical protein